MHDDLFAELGGQNAVRLGERRENVAGDFATKWLKEPFFPDLGQVTTHTDVVGRSERDRMANRPAEHTARLKD